MQVVGLTINAEAGALLCVAAKAAVLAGSGQTLGATAPHVAALSVAKLSLVAASIPRPRSSPPRITSTMTGSTIAASTKTAPSSFLVKFLAASDAGISAVMSDTRAIRHSPRFLPEKTLSSTKCPRQRQARQHSVLILRQHNSKCVGIAGTVPSTGGLLARICPDARLVQAGLLVGQEHEKPLRVASRLVTPSSSRLTQ